jgi:FdrA protein
VPTEQHAHPPGGASERVVIRTGTYHDSIKLMAVSSALQGMPGVLDGAVAAATPLNLGLLRDRGFGLPGEGVSPDALVVAIRAETEAALAGALDTLEELLRPATEGGGVGDGSSVPSRSLRSAVRRDRGLNLALISVPNAHAIREVSASLDAGLNVFCFSSGISLADEAALKRRAAGLGLLLMGPDCGTSVIDGLGLGFANAVRPGPVGLVGASGTGLQEVSCLLDRGGVGISQAIGVGGRDLTHEVGGVMSLQALRLLADHPTTEVVVLVSKPGDREVEALVRDRAGDLGKPAVLAFLGAGAERSGRGPVTIVSTIEEAAAAAASLVGAALPPDDPTMLPDETPGHIRGLYCGGSLCYEAMGIVSRAVGAVHSNIALRPEWALPDLGQSLGHTFVDFGDELLTEGRPHPMIDPALRNERVERELADPEVGVVLLDVVLGYGAHPDPSGPLAPLISEATTSRRGRLTVVVSLVGAADDRQDPSTQRAKLEGAGAVVTWGSAAAARVALKAGGWGGEAP